MARRVGTKGRAFNSRTAAQGAYRKNLKTRWSGKPAQRPDYVPKGIERNGKRYDVVFNRGTYGYWGPGNSWVALGAGSMLATGAMLAGQGYYYGSPTYGGRGARGGGFPVLLGALVLFAVVSSMGRRRRHH